MTCCLTWTPQIFPAITTTTFCPCLKITEMMNTTNVGGGILWRGHPQFGTTQYLIKNKQTNKHEDALPLSSSLQWTDFTDKYRLTELFYDKKEKKTERKNEKNKQSRNERKEISNAAGICTDGHRAIPWGKDKKEKKKKKEKLCSYPGFIFFKITRGISVCESSQKCSSIFYPVLFDLKKIK